MVDGTRSPEGAKVMAVFRPDEPTPIYEFYDIADALREEKISEVKSIAQNLGIEYSDVARTSDLTEPTAILFGFELSIRDITRGPLEEFERELEQIPEFEYFNGDQATALYESDEGGTITRKTE